MKERIVIVYVAIFISLLFSFDVFAVDILVSTPVTAKNINSAIASANPGDTVVIPDGTYNNISDQSRRAIKVLVSGSSGSEITIRPATVEGVKFTGTFYMVIGASGRRTQGNYIIVQDFKFEDIRSYSPSKITVKVLSVYGDNVRITNNYFKNISAPGNAGYGHMIKNYGGSNDCEIGYNTFINWWESIPVYPSTAMRIHIHHNSFVNNYSNSTLRTPVIHIGADVSYPTLNAVIEYNYFGRVWAGSEAIDNKSSYNTYRYNVFMGTPESPSSGITLRGGSNNTIDSNYFFNVGNLDTKDAPIRLWGANHIITNNYIEGTCNNSAIYIGVGTGTYQDVTNLQVINNTILDSMGYGIWFGYGSGNVPADLYFKNNLISQSAGYLVVDSGHTGDFTWTGNLHCNQGTATYWKNAGGSNEPRSGITHVDESSIEIVSRPPISINDVGASWLREKKDITPPEELRVASSP